MEFIKIDPYNFEPYRFKVGAFSWDSVVVVVVVVVVAAVRVVVVLVGVVVPMVATLHFNSKLGQRDAIWCILIQSCDNL